MIAHEGRSTIGAARVFVGREKWRIRRERSARHRVFFDEVSAKVKSIFEISKSWMFVFVAKMGFSFDVERLSWGDCRMAIALCLPFVSPPSVTADDK